MNTLAIILTLVAILLFLLAALKETTKPWMLPLGLALFAAGYLVQFWAPWPLHHF